MKTLLQFLPLLPLKEREEMLDILVQHPSLIPEMEQRLRLKIDGMVNLDKKLIQQAIEMERNRITSQMNELAEAEQTLSEESI